MGSYGNRIIPIIGRLARFVYIFPERRVYSILFVKEIDNDRRPNDKPPGSLKEEEGNFPPLNRRWEGY